MSGKKSAISCRWTGWVRWRNNRLKFRKFTHHFTRICRVYIPQMNESINTGRCQHTTNWILNHSDLHRLYMPKNFPGTGVKMTKCLDCVAKLRAKMNHFSLQENTYDLLALIYRQGCVCLWYSLFWPLMTRCTQLVCMVECNSIHH